MNGETVNRGISGGKTMYSYEHNIGKTRYSYEHNIGKTRYSYEFSIEARSS